MTPQSMAEYMHLQTDAKVPLAGAPSERLHGHNSMPDELRRIRSVAEASFSSE